MQARVRSVSPSLLFPEWGAGEADSPLGDLAVDVEESFQGTGTRGSVNGKGSGQGGEKEKKAGSNSHKSFPVRTGIVYKVTSPSGKGYVGQTRRKLEKRMARHRDIKWGHCKLLKRAIKRYGWGRMEVEVLWIGPIKMLDSKEVELIAAHGTLAPRGYNATPGGDTNPMHSVAGRQSIKDSWANPKVRAKHTQGRMNAWADPKKRANLMESRVKSVQAKLESMDEKGRKQYLARLHRQREKDRARRGAMRTASSYETQHTSVSTQVCNKGEGDDGSSRREWSARDLAHCGKKTKQMDIRVSFGTKASA